MNRDPRSRLAVRAASALLGASAALGGCQAQWRSPARLEPVAAKPTPGDGSRLRSAQPPEPVASFGLLSERDPGADRP